MRHRHFSREMTGYLAPTESLDESIRKEFEELCHSSTQKALPRR